MLSHEKGITGKYLDRELESSYDSLADVESFTEFTFLKYTKMPLTLETMREGCVSRGKFMRRCRLEITDVKSHCEGAQLDGYTRRRKGTKIKDFSPNVSTLPFTKKDNIFRDTKKRYY